MHGVMRSFKIDNLPRGSLNEMWAVVLSRDVNMTSRISPPPDLRAFSKNIVRLSTFCSF